CRNDRRAPGSRRRRLLRSTDRLLCRPRPSRHWPPIRRWHHDSQLRAGPLSQHQAGKGDAMSKVLDPAIRSYFFGKGYLDLHAVIADTWARNLASAQKELTAMRSLWPRSWTGKGLALVRGAAAASILVFGTAFFLVASILHVALLLTFFLLVYLGFTLVYLTEWAYLTWKGFFPVCPDCHSKNPLAEYFCPKCGNVHRRLIPSSYGILYRTCKCGQKLPATFFLQRGNLAAACPDCKRMLGGLI